MRTKKIVGIVLLCIIILLPVFTNNLTVEGLGIFNKILINLGYVSLCTIAISLILIDEFYE